uniref:glucan endo-1,3-beta-D-glucosidase n=1 Tax=Leersia perrieri TaxID=77586 RepID=A0A0D9WRY3_9ORYZ
MPRPGFVCPSSSEAASTSGCETTRLRLLSGSCSGSPPPDCGRAMTVTTTTTMSRSGRARWMLQALFFCVLLAIPSHDGPRAVGAFDGGYGINYGRIANNIPSPDKVVKLLRASKIRNAKIYDADHSVLDAFRGSGLNLVIAVNNGLLKDFAANESSSLDWLNDNVQPYLPQTRIVGITVGNEVLGGDPSLAEPLVEAVKNVYNGLKKLHLEDKIELFTPHSQAVFANSYPPSACVFKEDVMVYMKPLLDFFSKIGSPFYVNVYPFLAYTYDPQHIDINYALFKPNPGIVDPNTSLHYDNMFEAQLDAAYAALQAAGYNDMEVRVAETGWASSGDQTETGASVENARTYNFNLRKRLFLRKGTPLRPKIPVKAYIFALFNENSKSGAGSEKHYGLFNADGRIAYDIGYEGLLPSSASSYFLSLTEMYARF